MFVVACTTNNGGRIIQLLDENWQFINEEIEGGEMPETNTDTWKNVSVPHDWAISGEFDKTIDQQKTMVIEDGEKVPKMRTGRTGGLPHVGIGWYRKMLEIPSSMKNKIINIEFDGAMSNAKVYLNGEFIGEWPYGYSSFGFDLTNKVNFGGENLLAVRIENKPLSSRWYPGAGIYRNVRLVITNPTHIKQWGTYVTTPNLEAEKGTVKIQTNILNRDNLNETVTLLTKIQDATGNVVASESTDVTLEYDEVVNQSIEVENYKLWSIEQPVLYTVVSKIIRKGKTVDTYSTPFGFRYIEFTNNDGFHLNGTRVELNGVCLHHDLGPLGAAVNLSSLRHRLKLLQEMGCNSIRTSHNPPTPEMLDLADELGMLVIDESFDSWRIGKTRNSYSALWDEWAEKDQVALIHRDRNHPSVIMWSIGNEIREQGVEGGEKLCKFLVDICKREDPTRPTTIGLNQGKGELNRFAEVVDVVGFNYTPQRYNALHEKYPHLKMYGSETSSTVSSRGEYFFPAKQRVHYTREPFHCSSFDNEFPGWATSPDRQFLELDNNKCMAGEFVWTGFDYLGEPTPYNIQWPSRSSYFGIIDLCGIPKDRFYLYQARWTDKDVLHLLPHWNWKDGQEVSVHCYTSFDKGELFLNGKSLGVREKDSSGLYTTYRLVWDDVIYKLGEIKVVALDKNNNPVKETVVKTAGMPVKIILEADRISIEADGKELAFVTVSILDENDVLCPRANNLINFSVEGEGNVKAVGNGNPTSLESFVKPFRKAFNGKCMVIVQSTKTSGEFILKAESKGLESVEITIKTN